MASKMQRLRWGRFLMPKIALDKPKKDDTMIGLSSEGVTIILVEHPKNKITQ
jgi:hypothetical protein